MRKIKVNINRPQVSSAQVAGQQQFEQMLGMYKKAKYLFYAKVAAIATAVLVSAAVAGYIWLLNSEGSPFRHTQNTNKLAPDDPYAGTMVESQFFELNASKDTVVEGEKGTVIAIPAGAFLDEDGAVYTGNVQLEIAEAYTAEDLIAGNISTGKEYGIQKALFIKATGNGEELNYAPDKPVIAEVPASTTTQPQVILDGTRTDQGEMNWIPREPVKRFLVILPLEQLDFLPEGFEEEVQKHMPYRGREVADKALVDSLYYSLEAHLSEGGETADSVAATEESYPQLNQTNGMTIQLVNYQIPTDVAVSDTTPGLYESEIHCIHPASIKALKTAPYQNTFIATREFEQRLKFLFTLCDQSLLNIYVQHVHEDLWISDSLVAEKLGRNAEAGKQFLAWSRLRLTNTKEAPATSHLLMQYYKSRQEKLEKQLLEERAKYQKQLIKEDQQAQQVRENYSKLLEERYEYRLEKFGIPIKKNGTVAVAVILAQLPAFSMTVTVNGGDQYDHVHVYVVNPLAKSIFAMTSSDRILFDGEYAEDPHLLMWQGQQATVIAVGYKNDKIFAVEQKFTQQKVVDLNMTPVAVTEEQYRKMISANNSGYTRENKIEQDLAYQKKFYQEKLRQERLAREMDMMLALLEVACPCSFQANCAKGEALFMANCTSCHKKYENSAGPALAGISSRRSVSWIRQFIRNPNVLLKAGDPEAVALYNQYKSEMTAFPSFTDDDIDAILCYLNSNTKNKYSPVQAK